MPEPETNPPKSTEPIPPTQVLPPGVGPGTAVVPIPPGMTPEQAQSLAKEGAGMVGQLGGMMSIVPMFQKFLASQEAHQAEVQKALKQVLSNQVVLKRELDEIRGCVSVIPPNSPLDKK